MHAEQGAWKHNSSDQAAFFHCSMVQSWCSCSHCHFEWCTGFSIGTLSGLQLAYTANWLFWHLSIRTNFFGNLSYSSSPVGLDHTGAQTVFTPHVHHWARGTVGGSALFHCRPATVLPVIQQSQSVLCETCLNPFSYVKHISFEDKMFSYSHLLTGATIISVFHFAYQCLIS